MRVYGYDMARFWTSCLHFRLLFVLELAGSGSVLRFSGSGSSHWMLLVAYSVPVSASFQGQCCPAPAASASCTSASRPVSSSASTGWPTARTAPWPESSDSPAPYSNSRIIMEEVSSYERHREWFFSFFGLTLSTHSLVHEIFLTAFISRSWWVI